MNSEGGKNLNYCHTYKEETKKGGLGYHKMKENLIRCGKMLA